MNLSTLAPPALLVALAALITPLAACIPEGSPPDREITEGPDPVARLGLEAQFVWPAGDAQVSLDGIRFDEPSPLPLTVHLRNTGDRAVFVELDDLVMRPLAQPGDDPDGPVEAVYSAPPQLTLEPGAARVLTFGEVSLFFGFACTVHLTGEVRPVDGSAGARAISHDSPPILVDL